MSVITLLYFWRYAMWIPHISLIRAPARVQQYSLGTFVAIPLTMKPLKSDVFQAVFSARCSSKSKWGSEGSMEPTFQG